MTDVIEDLREGDIYRWSYRDPNVDLRQYGTYHCCSRIAVVKNGRLRDTYWGLSAGSDGRSFGVDDLPKLELTFVANFSDLEPAKEYQGDYYADEDIVNLNHANSSGGNFYLRKGAKRSKAKMLEAARYHLERAEATERSAASRAKGLREAIARIEAGEIDVYF
jgi:hypothetical protein